jgi:UDP-N-acetylglucosamine diphosphorylase/glucosamine-1-phosphate N-acetyltransferase
MLRALTIRALMTRRIVLFEDEAFAHFLPLTYSRSVFELRHGRKILLDRSAQRLGQPVHGIWTRDWIAHVAQLRCGAPANVGVDGRSVLVNGRWLMEGPIDWPAHACVGLSDGQIAYIVCDDALAQRLAPDDLLVADRREAVLAGLPRHETGGYLLSYPWDIVCNVAEALERDWDPAEAVLESPLDPRTHITNPAALSVAAGCRIHPTAVLDADSGPIYIGEQVTIGPLAIIEGPAYLGTGSRVSAQAWLHGGNSIGPVCKVGGELDGCVFQGYANKQHDGFLGHAYVGSWVNIGAGTINSDLKNTYGSVRVSLPGREVDSGQMFFGAILADHVKTGINTTIPTGAAIGFASVVATGKVLPKFVPSFSWLTDEGLASGDPGRLLDTAVKVMARRDVDMSDDEVELFLDLGSRTRLYEAP